jgi:hypothetical protein
MWIMDVTRTIRLEDASLREFLSLLQMLAEEGVRIDSPREWQRLKRLRELEERQERELRHELERQRELERRRELEERQERERQRLEERQAQERRELELWHSEEWRRVQLDQGASTDPHLNVFPDPDQVAISLVGTGATVAIAAAVKKFLEHFPHSKVEVKDETQDQTDGGAPRSRPPWD